MKKLIGFIICCFKNEHIPKTIDYDLPAFNSYYNEQKEIYEIHLCERCGLVYWIRS